MHAWAACLPWPAIHCPDALGGGKYAKWNATTVTQD
jgi:hypothetical protein